ncbi:MAG TPA: class I SAM-dependent methyltransferase [Candidatus Limnocylindrales bacterium]|nr:class I SAM-dependent methyltransferase [Candidatus Limnocylindrales bacterium]
MLTNLNDKSLEDTGERMIPAYHKSHMIYGEHIVRYQAAIELVKGKTVLDIASGSGYGVNLLGTMAAKVYGVDVNSDAIAYAKKNYGNEKTEFILGDGTRIPLDDNSIDVVVSFETIEHIENYRTFMSEVKRVLRSDGLFILSTPNDSEFPETNHFHIHEFERKELENLVRNYFSKTKQYYQGTWLYNALVPEEKMMAEWSGPIETIHTAPISLEKCLYFYLLCSNRDIYEEVKPLAAISEHWSERRKQETEESIRSHINEQGAIIRHHEDSLIRKDAEIQIIIKELEATRKELARIKRSLLGRAYKKLSTIKRKRIV